MTVGSKMTPNDELRAAAIGVLNWWESDEDHRGQFDRLRRALDAMPLGPQDIETDRGASGRIPGDLVRAAYISYHEGQS